MKKTNLNYLLLDPKEYLKPIGNISQEDLCKEWECRSISQLNHLLNKGKLYKNKYEVVEDENEKRNESFHSQKFEESEKFIWYITDDGRIYSKNKINNKIKWIKVHKNRRNHLVCRVNKRNITLKNLVAKYFLDNYKDGDIIRLKNENEESVHKNNIVIIPRKEFFREMQHNRVCKPVGLFKNDICIKKWASIKDATEYFHYDSKILRSYLSEENNPLGIRFI